MNMARVNPIPDTLAGSQVKHRSGSCGIARFHAAFLRGCGDFCGLVIGLMAISISVDVVMRNFGWGNLPWLLDAIEYAVFITTFVAAPWALRIGSHVRLDVLVKFVPPPLGRVLEVIADSIGVVISATLVYYGFDVTHQAYAANAVIFKVLVFPEWWLLWIIPVFSAVLGLEFVLRIGRVLRGEDSVVTGLELAGDAQ